MYLDLLLCCAATGLVSRLACDQTTRYSLDTTRRYWRADMDVFLSSVSTSHGHPAPLIFPRASHSSQLVITASQCARNGESGCKTTPSGQSPRKFRSFTIIKIIFHSLTVLVLNFLILCYITVNDVSIKILYST